MTDRPIPPEKSLAITKHVVNSYAREPGSDFNVQAEGFGIVRALADRLTTFRKQNVGLNRNDILAARTAYETELVQTGKPVQDDPMLAFMDRQLAFNNQVGSTLLAASSYPQRLLAARAREREKAKVSTSDIVTNSLPDNFLNPRQLDQFRQFEDLLIERSAAVFPGLGFNGFDIDEQFITRKLPLWGSAKTTRFVLKLWEDPNYDSHDLSYIMNERGAMPLVYHPVSRWNKHWLMAYYVPLLVPKVKGYRGYDADTAYGYLNNEGANEATWANLHLFSLDQSGLDKLLTVIGHGMLAEFQEGVLNH